MTFMVRVLSQVVLVVALVAAVSLSPALAQDRDPEAIVQAMVDHLLAEDFEAAGADFSPEMQQALPPDTLQATWEGLAEQVGSFQEIVGAPQVTQVNGNTLVVIAMQFEAALLDMQAAVSADGQITGLYFQPSAAAPPDAGDPKAIPDDLPDYIDLQAFEEREAVLNEGTDWELPGTLTVPAGKGPFPAVVLVHGSGPNDRDETIGPNKPFRDLAWGLASQGIAVLRYDKRSHVHGRAMVELPQMTVDDEVIEDAVAAVRLLRREGEVDPDRVFVVGHSLGGYLAPRIAAEADGVAGVVILAGNARPLHDLIVMQTEYLLGLDGELSEQDREQIGQVEQVKEAIDNLNAAAPGAFFGAPAAYWVDLRGYDPIKVARSLDVPLLILQGERDYQVTMEDFARWQEGLSGQDDVTFISYARLNHLLMSGEGPGSPQEYEQPGYVDAPIVGDIAGWILDN